MKDTFPESLGQKSGYTSYTAKQGSIAPGEAGEAKPSELVPSRGGSRNEGAAKSSIYLLTLDHRFLG